MQDDIFEYQILASAFRVPGSMKRFCEELDPVTVGLIHGYTGIHEIYKNLVAYHNKIGGDVVEPIAFKSWLKSETNIVEAVGGIVAVEELFAHVMAMELTSVDSIVKLTQFRADKRKQLDDIQRLKSLISEKGQMTDATKEEIIKLTNHIQELEQDLEYDPLASIRTAYNIADEMDSLWDIPPALPTQFPSLNKALGYSETTGGIPRGTVSTIAALSGKGKSTLAKCFTNHWLNIGYTVLFINFEETKSHWERILMTQVTETNVYAESQNLSPKKKAELSKVFKDKMAEWGNRLMVRHDPDTLFFEDLESWLRDILGHGVAKPDVVIIDTIQSLFTKSGGKARWGEFEQIMVRLERLAKDMDAAFIITAQQNINSTKEKREEINQSDIGGSVTINQKSAVVMFITPVKDIMNDETIEDTRVQVQITKNRITGTVFTADPPILTFDDYTKSFIKFDPNIFDDKIEYNKEMLDKSFGDFNPV